MQLVERKFSGLVIMGSDRLGVGFNRRERASVYSIGSMLLASIKNVFQ